MDQHHRGDLLKQNPTKQVYVRSGLSRRGWSPLKIGPPGLSAAKYLVPPDQISQPYLFPPCRGWSHPWRSLIRIKVHALGQVFHGKMDMSNQLEAEFSRRDKTVGVSTCVQFKLWTRRTPMINHRWRATKISPHRRRIATTKLYWWRKRTFTSPRSGTQLTAPKTRSEVFDGSLRN